MSSGGVHPPQLPSHDSSGKGTSVKKKRYMVRLIPPRDSLVSSIPFSFTVSMAVRSFEVAPTPSPPLTKVRPSPSHLDTCGSFLVPTSTSSPSPVIANMPTDNDIPNLAMEDPLPPPPLNDRPMVLLFNGEQVL